LSPTAWSREGSADGSGGDQEAVRINCSSKRMQAGNCRRLGRGRKEVQSLRLEKKERTWEADFGGKRDTDKWRPEGGAGASFPSVKARGDEKRKVEEKEHP